MTELPPRLQQSLTARTRELLSTDSKIKDYTARKARIRQAFFDLATKAVKADLQTKVVRVIDEAKTGTQVEQENPGWKVKSWRQFSDHTGSVVEEFLLEEDPAVKKFSFVNPENGKVFGRTYAEQGASFDCERLLRDDLYLANAVLDATQVCTISAGHWWQTENGEFSGDDQRKNVMTFVLNEKAAEAYCAEHPEAVAILQQYATPGTLQVRLAPVQDAKS